MCVALFPLWNPVIGAALRERGRRGGGLLGLYGLCVGSGPDSLDGYGMSWLATGSCGSKAFVLYEEQMCIMENNNVIVSHH